MVITYIFLSVLVVSLISLIGVVSLLFDEKRLEKILFWLISFAAGSMLGGAFIHLLPELINSGNVSTYTSISILSGIFIFFILEKIIHWRHCHVLTSNDHPHSLALMNLIGDGLHNFLDGVLIAGSYMVSPSVGLATTVAVALHEIPQEIGDFGVLIHAGLTRTKALFFNLLSALVSVAGAFLTIWLYSLTTNIINTITAFAAGGFIYIAVGDLLPELKKESGLVDSLKQIFGLLAGIAIMIFL